MTTKRLLLIALFAFIALIVCNISAHANPVLQCGLPPLKPLGCNIEPTCVCDESGDHCVYLFVGC